MRTAEHNEKIAAALTRFWANRPSLFERAMAQVDQSGGPDACWPYMGSRDTYGYGRIKEHSRKYQKAHRVIYKGTGHALPDDQQLLHSCDNPPCCNPAHTYPGGPTENMRDAIKRGQYPVGEQHNQARLSDSQVAEIRTMYKLREWSQTKLAARFGVSQHHISRIVRGLSRSICISSE